jgi:hypothetical protein
MDKPLTITEFASLGGRAQKETYSRGQLKQWGKMGGRPRGSKDAKPRKRRLDTKRTSTSNS